MLINHLLNSDLVAVEIFVGISYKDTALAQYNLILQTQDSENAKQMYVPSLWRLHKFRLNSFVKYIFTILSRLNLYSRPLQLIPATLTLNGPPFRNKAMQSTSDLFKLKIPPDMRSNKVNMYLNPVMANIFKRMERWTNVFWRLLEFQRVRMKTKWNAEFWANQLNHFCLQILTKWK